MTTRVYACQNRDSAVRAQSSSGGIFWMLAKYVLDQQGVVCGAAFDEEWQVAHTCAKTEEDARKFIGSKYVQSKMGSTYQEVKGYLEQKRLVLFSGTPCQVAGLYAYLGKRPENLYTVDLICHGAPSRRVWREYLQEIQQRRTIQAINFRDKTEGWLKFSLKIEFTDGSSYRKNLQEDLYMKGFLQDMYLRPSCYSCRFRGWDRDADLTLADFWGVEYHMPELFDDQGTSLVITHSQTGESLLQQLPQLKRKKVFPELVEKTNPSVITSVELPQKRTLFFEKRKTNERLIHYLKRMTTDSLMVRRKRKIKNIIKKVLVKCGLWRK